MPLFSTAPYPVVHSDPPSQLAAMVSGPGKKPCFKFCAGLPRPCRARPRRRSRPHPFLNHMQADRDPRDNEEEVPSDAEAEEPSRAAEGSDDEGEDLMDQMEA